MPKRHDEATNGGGVGLTNPLAERAVIGSILAHPARAMSYVVSMNVIEDWFTDRVCFNAFKAITKLLKDGKIIDKIMVGEEIQKMHNGFVIASEFQAAFAGNDETSITTLVQHITLIRDKYRRSSVNYFLEDARAKIRESDSSPLPAIISTMSKCIHDVLKETEVKERNIEQLGESIISSFELSRSMGGMGVEYPWPALRFICQGAVRGKITMVAARPGEGKSTFANQMADYTAVVKGEAVGVWSLEMTAEEWIKCQVGQRLGLEVKRFNEGKFTDEQLDKFKQGLKDIEKAPLYVDDNSYGIDMLCAVIRDKVLEKGLSLVVIDYLGMILPDGSRSNSKSTQEEVGGWSNALTNLAKECPTTAFIVLHQLNRAYATDGGRPQLHHLRDSGKLEQDAYAVIMVYQDPNCGEGTMSDNAPTIFEFAKNRGGPKGSCSTTFEKSKQRFV